MATALRSFYLIREMQLFGAIGIVALLQDAALRALRLDDEMALELMMGASSGTLEEGS
ncbi:hypothetical protein ABID19_006781 [Mesorhizobium robiniae]|uniref:Uncharacterized protein n=1 Tax=Mesorhizobium robiniae TaxID=559315 RepID=A0ABV2GZK1_9HYPH|nr:hypothetical protein [Mesorhizobium sp. ZC-5]MCV3244035.1 hypothetical protein [Mesorhizobium sp. ZC-5]